MEIRDRIVGLERIKARDLRPHALNPRRHPEPQLSALRISLERIGYADCLIAYRTPEGRLQLIDGHARRDLTPEAEVPVLITDLTEEEAAFMLAIGDPLSAMAENDARVMEELLKQTDGDLLAELMAAGGDALAALLGQGALPEFQEFDGESFAGVEDEWTEVKFKVRLGDVPGIEAAFLRVQNVNGIPDSEKGRALSVAAWVLGSLPEEALRGG